MQNQQKVMRINCEGNETPLNVNTDGLQREEGNEFCYLRALRYMQAHGKNARQFRGIMLRCLWSVTGCSCCLLISS